MSYTLTETTELA